MDTNCPLHKTPDLDCESCRESLPNDMNRITDMINAAADDPVLLQKMRDMIEFHMITFNLNDDVN